MMKCNLSIYVHIPFCVKKCLYCDFISFSDKNEYFEDYKNIIVNEILNFDNSEKYIVNTIFFGGGTPSIFTEEFFFDIVSAIYKKFEISDNLEFSVEVNPGTVNNSVLKNFVKCGVNRISIGAQSFNDDILKKIGRIHSSEDFFKSYEMIRKAGFDNVGIDIMFGLPGQSVFEWEDTLKTAVKLSPEHISAYSLIIEENTPFYDLYEKNKLLIPDEDIERKMYYLAKDILKSAGYEHYEISNFAKPDCYSRHNMVYWKRGEYIGFGLNAGSFLNGFRFKNTENMQAYLNGSDYEEIEEIKGRNAYCEFMFLGLRMIEGISISEFKSCFDKDIFDIYGKEINKFINSGFIAKENDRIYLTDKGIDVSNQIFVEFL